MADTYVPLVTKYSNITQDTIKTLMFAIMD